MGTMAPGLLRFRKPAIDPAMSDEALVALARHDRQAFGVLYDRYIDLVYRYCLSRLRDREDAEDVTSLIFARALAGLDNQPGAGGHASLLLRQQGLARGIGPVGAEAPEVPFQVPRAVLA